MKILNIGQNYRVAGGSDRYFMSLAQLLEGRGHSVVPFAARHPDNRGTEWAEYFPAGVDTRSPGLRDVLRFVYSLPAKEGIDRLLSVWEPDIAHLHVYYGQLTASIFEPLEQAGIPTVQTLHDCKLGCPVRTFVSRGEICEACGGEQFWQALPRRCNEGSFLRTGLNVLEAYVSRWSGDVKGVDHFVAPSRFLREKMLEHEILDPGEITVQPNFVDPDLFSPADGPGRHFLYVGRVRRMKGIGTLVRAASTLTDVPLVVVGEGRDREQLEETTRDRGLDHVRFPGFREGSELHALIRGAVAVVVPSEMYENCPMAILEAMALGRPVIGSRIGGVPELVEDGTDGLLFAPGDVEGLRDRLEWMAEHRREAARMGERARRKIVGRFGPDPHYEGLMDVYARVT